MYSTRLASPNPQCIANTTTAVVVSPIQQLQADLDSNNIEKAVISETWLKSHHTDQAVGITGYNIFRKDRGVRRRGGVGIYVTDKIQSRVGSARGIWSPRNIWS